MRRMTEKFKVNGVLEQIFAGVNVDAEYFALLLKRARIRKLKKDFQLGKYQPDLTALSEKIIWEEVWEHFYFKDPNKEQD